MGEETSKREDVVGREEVDLEAGSGNLLLNDGEYGLEVLENEGADGKGRTFGMRRTGSGEKTLLPETVMAASLMSMEKPGQNCVEV